MSYNNFFLLSTTFLSCCSAVIFLELLVKEDPGCGNVVTLSAFLFISIEGFITTMDLGRKKMQVPVSEWFKLVCAFFICNVINNGIFNYKIAIPLYTVFRSVSHICLIPLKISFVYQSPLHNFRVRWLHPS